MALLFSCPGLLHPHVATPSVVLHSHFVNAIKMSVSEVSSIDHDIEKYGASTFGGVNQQYGERRTRRMSRTRTHSPNFSRPSPPDSVDESANFPRRRRSEDDEPDRASFRQTQNATPDFTRHSSISTPSLLQSPTGTLKPKLPPFAPKAGLLHHPPPVIPSSPALTQETKRLRKTSRSMDVVEAARSVPWQDSSDSTRSLMSTIREKSQLESTTFAQRVFEAGKPDLLYDLTETKRFKDRKYGVLDLTTLERMNQHVLQQKLTEQVKAIGDQGAWMEIGIKEALHDYCECHLSRWSDVPLLTELQAKPSAIWSSWSVVRSVVATTIPSSYPPASLLNANCWKTQA